MKLNEMLELKYEKKKNNDITTIGEVYGIIYRISCIPESKSYIGQTYSHTFTGKYLCKHGIINRIKDHYKCKDEELYKNRPLYSSLNKYTPEQFEVFEELRIEGKDLVNINQIEQEYIRKHNTLKPYGYNLEEIGKMNTKILKTICDFYKVDLVKTVYIDKTRDKRKKDISVGTYFGLKRNEIELERILELLKSIKIEYVKLTDSNGLRILVKPIDENVNIRIYYSKNKDECVKYANQISNNVILSESFKGVYKYQTKIDEIIKMSTDIRTVIGKIYSNKGKHQTYLIIFYGLKNTKIQQFKRVSFGGATINIENSYKVAIEFINNLQKYEETKHFTFKLENI